MRSLDVPASEVRHPAVFGPLGRSRPLAVHELDVRPDADRPAGEGRAARAVPADAAPCGWSASRTAPIARASTWPRTSCACSARSCTISSPPAGRSSSSTSPCSRRWCSRAPRTRAASCAARSARRATPSASSPSPRAHRAGRGGLPRERLALHVCRGNWTRDERAALAGRLPPLLPLLAAAPRRHASSSSSCTPRAGELDVLAELPRASASASASSTRSSDASRRWTRSWRAPAAPSTSSAPIACCSRRTAASPRSPTTRSPSAARRRGQAARDRPGRRDPPAGLLRQPNWRSASWAPAGAGQDSARRWQASEGMWRATRSPTAWRIRGGTITRSATSLSSSATR